MPCWGYNTRRKYVQHLFHRIDCRNIFNHQCCKISNHINLYFKKSHGICINLMFSQHMSRDKWYMSNIYPSWVFTSDRFKYAEISEDNFASMYLVHNFLASGRRLILAKIQKLSSSQVIKFSDRSLKKSNLPALFWNCDRPTDRPTNQQTDIHEGSKGSYTSNNTRLPCLLS